MKYVYNKLVRDKIPEEINKKGDRKANYRILNDKEYIEELDKKLFEEAHEFVEEHSVEELADLMEVINAIMKIKNISLENVQKEREIKNYKKGKFENRIFLIDVEQEYDSIIAIRKVASPDVHFALRICTAQGNLTLLLQKFLAKFPMQ